MLVRSEAYAQHMGIRHLIPLLLLASSCAAPANVPPPTVPIGGDFYTPTDPLPEGDPGDVIWAEPLFAPEGTSAWTILYHSVGFDGQRIAVSGWVAIPNSEAPKPVVAFAHGTTGLGDQCAPTRRGGQAPHNFQEALDRGWAVAYTDYQGLGTPGLHHYLVGSVEAQAVIDVARSAAHLDDRITNQVAFWGFSQGGHAALFAAELADEIAPELEVVGAVAAAPAVDISGWMNEDPAGQRHFLAMIAIAYVDALGLEASEVLSGELLKRSDEIKKGCLMDATVALSGVPSLFRDGAPPPELSAFFVANDPGQSRFATPVLLATGDQDPLLPPTIADAFVTTACAAGITIDRVIAGGATHLATLGETTPDAMQWLAERFAGLPTTGVCD